MSDLTFYPNLLYFPRCLQRDRMWSWELGAKVLSGGMAISGLAPKARLDGGGMWIASLGEVQLSSVDQVSAWRAVAASLDGGATPIVLEARDTRFAPWPTVNGVQLTGNDATCADGATCSDGSDFEGDVIEAVTVGATALRATSITLAFTVGAALKGGEYFSIEHTNFSHRLYRVARVEVNGSGQSVCIIRPPLREATPSGTRVDFNYPKCVVKLAKADGMDLALVRRYHGQASTQFIEDFPPFDTAEAIIANNSTFIL